jgi:hypothetical protein
MSTYQQWIDELNAEVEQMKMDLHEKVLVLLEMHGKQQIDDGDFHQELAELDIESEFISEWYRSGKQQIDDRRLRGLLL